MNKCLRNSFLFVVAFAISPCLRFDFYLVQNWNFQASYFWSWLGQTLWHEKIPFFCNWYRCWTIIWMSVSSSAFREEFPCGKGYVMTHFNRTRPFWCVHWTMRNWSIGMHPQLWKRFNGTSATLMPSFTSFIELIWHQNPYESMASTFEKTLAFSWVQNHYPNDGQGSVDGWLNGLKPFPLPPM